MQGKILRIDVDARTAGEYGIPNDNPFLADSDYRPEIFVMGLRNPWRCSFDTDAPSKLYCGDVGQNAWEEVDVLDVKQIIADKYSNLGWPIFEGTLYMNRFKRKQSKFFLVVLFVWFCIRKKKKKD